jgi:hypothetical protein
MNRRSILTKTGKGLMEATGKTSALSRDLRNILKEIDGKVSVSELLRTFSKMTEPELLEGLKSMEREGYLREFVGKQEEAPPRPSVPRAPTAPSAADSGEDLDFTAFTPAKPSAKTSEDARLQAQAQDIARQAQATRAREEAAAKAKAEIAARARAEAEHKARLSARAGLDSSADVHAKAQAEALDRARREAEERQRREAEEKARREAVTRAVIEAEQAGKREAEERIRREIEERTRRENEEKARRDADVRARRDAEEKVRRDAEERVRREAEERTRKEIEERMRREEAERLRREEYEQAERRSRIESEARVKVEAEMRAKRESEERARREEEERPRREEELRRRMEEEERARRETEDLERSLREQEENARREAEYREREESERRQEEERALREAEEESQRGEEARRAEEEETRAKEEKKHAKQEEKRIRAEEKAQAKAAKKARKAARARGRTEEDDEARDSKESALSAREIWAKRRPGGLAKQFAVMLLLTLIVGVAVLPFVPLESGPYEKAAQAWLGEPVKIGTVNLTLLPIPQLKFEKVVIGKEHAMRAGLIRATPVITSLLEDRIPLKSFELENATFPREFLSALLRNKGSRGSLGVERITAKGLKLDIPELNLPALDVNAILSPDGALKSVAISNAEHRLSVKLQPQGERAAIEISADTFPLPIGVDPGLSEFFAKGTVTRSELALSEAEARVFGGRLLGTVRLRWSGGWSMEGELTARQMEAGKIAAPLIAGGTLQGKGVYSMKGLLPERLILNAHLEGNFNIQKGAISNVDMTRMLQGSGSGGGTTLFSEMSGGVSADANRILVRQVRMAAGLLSGTGQGEMDPQKNLSGRFQIELRAQSVQARATLAIAGTLENPQFRRSN